MAELVMVYGPEKAADIIQSAKDFASGRDVERAREIVRAHQREALAWFPTWRTWLAVEPRPGRVVVGMDWASPMGVLGWGSDAEVRRLRVDAEVWWEES